MEKTGQMTQTTNALEEVKKTLPLYFHIPKRRLIYYAISLIIIIPGLISFFIQGLNVGIDYRGGTMLVVPFNQSVTQAGISEAMQSVGLDGTVQLADGDTTVLIRTETLDVEKRTELMAAFEASFGEIDMEGFQEEIVGPSMGEELTRNAVIALIIAMAGMIVYIAIRFQFVFGICGILGIVHDVLVVIGLFSLFQWEINAAFVAAILMIVGYSINNTVVIFDRIRENEPKMKRSDSYADMVDLSLWQTMYRSVNTFATIILALLAIFIFGGDSTKMFSLAMLIGLTSGAYTSIFIASQLLLEAKGLMRKRPPGKGGSLAKA